MHTGETIEMKRFSAKPLWRSHSAENGLKLSDRPTFEPLYDSIIQASAVQFGARKKSVVTAAEPIY